MTQEEGRRTRAKIRQRVSAHIRDDHLEYLGLDETAFTEIVDMHRNSEIWSTRKHVELRHPPE